MADIRGDVPVYPIGVVRKLTGLSDRQIRYYEQIGLLRPARTDGGRRMYSQIDVERLIKIRAFMERGLRTDEIRGRLGLDRRGAGDASASAPARSTLPHFAGGEPAGEVDPDVAARQVFMTRQPTRREP